MAEMSKSIIRSNWIDPANQSSIIMSEKNLYIKNSIYAFTSNRTSMLSGSTHDQMWFNRNPDKLFPPPQSPNRLVFARPLFTFLPQ